MWYYIGINNGDKDMNNKDKRHVIFWIKSNRGTDDMRCFEFRKNTNNNEIEDRLQDWCSNFGCWNSSESIVRYGWKDVKMPPRKELTKIYDQAVKSKHNAVEKWKKYAAMLNPTKVI